MKYRDELTKDADAMEDAMSRVADRSDIWQDRLIYALCKAVYDLLAITKKIVALVNDGARKILPVSLE